MRYLAHALTVTSMVVATLIGGVAAADERPVLGIAAIDLQNSFFVRMKEAGDVAAQDYDVKTVWQSAEASLERQIAIIENYIAQDVDVILIDPMDKNALIPVIKKAEEAGIPVVTMGNRVEAGWNYATLYPDIENMGMVARALGNWLGGEGKVALLVGQRGNFVSDTREKGFVSVIEAEFPNVDIVSVQPTDWDSSKATDIAQTVVTANPDLAAIACIADMLCLPAQAGVAAAGGEVIYASHDADAELLPMLERGDMVINVLTGAYRVGYWNVAVGARLARGAEFGTKELKMPTYFVTSDGNAEKLKSRGLSFEYISPDAAVVEATNYSEQMGPSQPDAILAGTAAN